MDEQRVHFTWKNPQRESDLADFIEFVEKEKLNQKKKNGRASTRGIDNSSRSPFRGRHKRKRAVLRTQRTL